MQSILQTGFPDKSPPPHVGTPPFSAPNQNITISSSKDNNTANFNCNTVKFEMQPDQSLIIIIVGSISIRVRIMSATVANFLLKSARSTFLLFLTLASLTWTLRAYNWASWLTKSIFLLSIDF